ncbi:MAG: hypothetical protein WBA74_15710 [Cyclobacteriaceae bacterium]
MKKQNLNLALLRVQSFVTTINGKRKIIGGQICPDVSRAFEHCVSAEHMDGCMSTGNTDDPTGLFSIDAPGCIGSGD